MAQDVWFQSGTGSPLFQVASFRAKRVIACNTLTNDLPLLKWRHHHIPHLFFFHFFFLQVKTPERFIQTEQNGNLWLPSRTSFPFCKADLLTCSERIKRSSLVEPLMNDYPYGRPFPLPTRTHTLLPTSQSVFRLLNPHGQGWELFFLLNTSFLFATLPYSERKDTLCSTSWWTIFPLMRGRYSPPPPSTSPTPLVCVCMCVWEREWEGRERERECQWQAYATKCHSWHRVCGS